MFITEKTSRTIMVANLMAIIMIIAIHYNTRCDIAAHGIVSGWNYLTQEFFTNGLARSAVPYFALISGFFLYAKYTEHGSYGKLLRSRFHTLFVPYVLAATMIFLSIAFAKLLKGNMSVMDIRIVLYRILITPFSSQFWFLRDLCLLVIISPLLLPKSRPLQYALGLSLFLPWLMNWQIMPKLGDWPIINIETLFFFYLGGQLSCRAETLNRIVDSSAKSTALTALLLTAVLITRIRLDPTLDVWYGHAAGYGFSSLILYKAAIMIGIICLIQVSSLFHESASLIYLSGLSFFAFLFHFVPLSFLVSRLSDRIIAEGLEFYFSFPVATVTVFVIAHMVFRVAPRLFGMLCGGRNPGKAMNRMRSWHNG